MKSITSLEKNGYLVIDSPDLVDSNKILNSNYVIGSGERVLLFGELQINSILRIEGELNLLQGQLYIGVAPQGLSYEDIVVNENESINLIPSINEATSITYSISPSLPSGLSLNTSTGVISGTAFPVQNLTSYTVTATNNAGVSTTTLNIIINAIAPNGLSYSDIVVNQNTSTTSTPILNAGSLPITYSISPSLPSGLSINNSTGVISGTPTNSQSITSYTVTATNDVGSTTATINITVNLPAPSGLSYNSGQTAIPLVSTSVSYSPTLNVGINITYSISPSLPVGLSINSSSGVISGTTPSSSNDTTYTITATNSSGSTTASFRIRIVFFTGTINPKGIGAYSSDPSFFGYGYNSGYYNLGGETYDNGSPQPVGALSNNGSYTIGLCMVYDFTGDGGGYSSGISVKGNHVSLSQFTKAVINGTSYSLSPFDKRYESNRNYTYMFYNGNTYPGTFAWFPANTSGTVSFILE